MHVWRVQRDGVVAAERTLLQVLISRHVALQDEFAVQHLRCVMCHCVHVLVDGRVAANEHPASVWSLTRQTTHSFKAQLQQIIVRDRRFGRHRTAGDALSR